jgi:murein DD-endopeptidase MepM/ murein hydrolase activator NlpD
VKIKVTIAWLGVLAVLGCAAPSASAAGDPAVAALQVGLRAHGLYAGTVDGLRGPATSAALRSLQSSSGLGLGAAINGRLGRFAPRPLGSRVLAEPMVGFDVAEVQFELAWLGFPSGHFDGRFGTHLTAAVKRFQRWAGLNADGVVGQATIAALARPTSVIVPRLARPVGGAVGDGFGPRGDRFHAGIDIEAPAGVPVGAAAAGEVTWAGVRSGWGLCVVVAHGQGIRTLYAHLGSATVSVGTPLSVGAQVGRVGSTGDSTGPHLHFEVRINGAAIDPLLALQ